MSRSGGRGCALKGGGGREHLHTLEYGVQPAPRKTDLGSKTGEEFKKE